MGDSMTSGLRSTLSDRQALWAFVLGCVAVTAGVLLHLPMFLMSRSMGYHMAGMPMDTPMLIGMFLIVAGVFVAAYGLLPRNFVAHREAAVEITISAPDDAALGSSEEHTSELQSLMRISYAVFCLKQKNTEDEAHIQ